MKKVVFLEDLKESEIRPDVLYDKYKDMLEDELSTLFADQSQFIQIDCPGCCGNKCENAFKKFGFQYCRCGDCGSLFVSPRPTADMLDIFRKDSQAVSFWSNEIAQRTKESRYLNKSFPMAHWVLELVDEYFPEAKVFLDYNSKYSDLLNTINQMERFSRAISVKPELLGQEELFPKDTIVINSLDSLSEEVDVFTAFEVLEREFDPVKFIEGAHSICRNGGLLFLTTNTISGFEFQMLNSKSPRLHPPDRMNLLSIEAISDRLTKTGFEVIELSTPGRLDVEIVRNALINTPDFPIPGFFKYIFQNRDEKAWHSLQDFLQQHQLSSYVRIVAKKR